MFILTCVCFSFIVKMGHRKNSAWDHVVKLHGYESSTWIKHWKCKYCQNEYIDSRTRIKAHLIGDRSKQIVRCVQVFVEIMRMFSSAPSFESEGSSQHPIPSHTPAHNVQQILDTGGMPNVASNA
jgi:hypothetical protein